MIHWTFGTLTRSSWSNIAVVALVLTVCVPLLLRLSRDLNVMASAGDEVATSLGVNCGRTRVICMTLSTAITATIISLTGLIGFVGLVAPHITRLLIGGDHRYLLPASGITSAMILLVADTAGRTLFSPIIIPVGIVTSFIGAPFFFYLLMRNRRHLWQ